MSCPLRWMLKGKVSVWLNLRAQHIEKGRSPKSMERSTSALVWHTSDNFLIVFHTLTLLWLSGEVDVQCVHLSMSYLRRGTFIMVYICIFFGGGGWCARDAMTFCQENLSAPGLSVALGAESISWQATASLWKVTCALWSTCNEYDGTSKRGSGLWNILQWVLRTSQSGWEIRSWVFRPLTVAKSKGP